jgi:hypothetical protein
LSCIVDPLLLYSYGYILPSSIVSFLLPFISCSILIDDRLALKADWEKQGGIFIHHVKTESTLRQLRDKGILTIDVPANHDKSTIEATTSASAGSHPAEESDGTNDDDF